MKNPHNFFNVDYYTTSQVDQIVYNITVSGISLQQFNEAIVDFRTSDQIDVTFSAATNDFLTLLEINAMGSAYTEDFLYSNEIDGLISGYTSTLMTNAEVDTVFSGFTSGFLSVAGSQSAITSAITLSQNYWHPSPYYERLFFTNNTGYTLASTDASTVNINVTGNTYWYMSYTGATSWLRHSIRSGTTSTTIVETANSANVGIDRTTYITFSGTECGDFPYTIYITQSGSAD